MEKKPNKRDNENKNFLSFTIIYETETTFAALALPPEESDTLSTLSHDGDEEHVGYGTYLCWGQFVLFHIVLVHIVFIPSKAQIVMQFFCYENAQQRKII